LLTDFVDCENIFSLAQNLILTIKSIKIMKKLAMVLALAFTMGLAASTVNATTSKDDNKKAKTECCSKDKKATCSKDKKACCTKATKTDDKAKETK
jgi:hypothetical protein